MERMEGQMRRRKGLYHILLLLLFLQITTHSSAQNTTTTITPNSTTTTTASAPNPAALTYTTHPADVVAAVGEPAVFRCGVAEASAGLTFTFYGSRYNYTLTCPNDHVEDIPQALDGSCEVKNAELLAVWTLKGTSFSDNGTRVVCQQMNNPDAPSARLFVYDNGTAYSVLIGCTIGGFFGILLVFGLSYAVLQRSETLRRCFGGKETEDDMTTIVTKD